MLPYDNQVLINNVQEQKRLKPWYVNIDGKQVTIEKKTCTNNVPPFP